MKIDPQIGAAIVFMVIIAASWIYWLNLKIFDTIALCILLFIFAGLVVMGYAISTGQMHVTP